MNHVFSLGYPSIQLVTAFHVHKMTYTGPSANMNNLTIAETTYYFHKLLSTFRLLH